MLGPGMPVLRPRTGGVCLTLLTGLTPLAASAAAPAPASASAVPVAQDLRAQAAALYKEGAGLFREGKFREAGERFQAAYNLDPSPILLYNLARAAEELGEATTAVNHYKAYLARYPQAEDRAEVERRIRVLEAVRKTAATGSLALAGVPEGAMVFIDGAPAPAPGPEGLRALSPGSHVVRIVPVDGPPSESSVDVRAGTTATVNHEPAASPADEAGPARPLRLWGWISTGVGVAVAGVGTYFYLDSFSAADDYKKYGNQVDALDSGSPTYLTDLDRLDGQSQDALDRMDTDLLLGRVLLGVGGVAIAGGVTMLVLDLTRTDEKSSAAANPRATLVPLPGGLGLVGQF
jgi:tetratricopeptide (TPR) repeat protein